MTQINIPLDITFLEITFQSIDKEDNIVLGVVSKNTSSTCHKCGKPAIKRNGMAPTRLIRHLTTLNKYKSYIANYFKARKNSGFVEGLNNKIKVAKRRSYEFIKTGSLFPGVAVNSLNI